MIQITFTHTVKSSHLGKDINELIEQGFAEIRDAIYAGYTQLIKDNVILNCSAVTNENNRVVSMHFATSPENSQLFLSYHLDGAKFWETYGVDWQYDQHEIDFDTVDPHTLTQLIYDDSLDSLYGVNIPSKISSPSAVSAK